MKCAQCQAWLSGHTWTITDEAPTGTYTANYHHACLQYVLTGSAVRKLESAVVQAAWVHPPLPLRPDTIT